MVRDDAEIHLWGASDEAWRSRADLAERPVDGNLLTFFRREPG